MKWENIGHELDKLISFYDLDIDNDFSVFAFGEELYGRRLFEYGKHRNLVKGYIVDDSVVDTSNRAIKNEKIYTYNEFLENYNFKIVITAKGEKANLIEKKLVSVGKEKYKHYYHWDEFVRRVYPLYELYRYNFLHVLHSQISLTERCTLKCKYCCHGCNYVDNTQIETDLSPQIVKKSADYFFKKFDRVDRFALLGGEPFLYKNLNEVVEYIGKNYRDMINEFYFITNGTVIPHDSVLEMCKKYNISIHISNYSLVNNWLKCKYDILIERLHSMEVSYCLENSSNEWIDFGFKKEIHTPEEALHLFNICGSQCREIRDSKLFYCIMARSYSENTKMNIGEYDYIDLSDCRFLDKKVIFEYCMGYSDKGYLDMCKYCNGMNTTKTIPAGEQM